MIASKAVCNVISQNGEDGNLWFVSKTCYKYQPPFRSGTAPPLSRESVMMYSGVRASLFAFKWTVNDTMRPCRSSALRIWNNAPSPLPRNMDFFCCCFYFAALPVITLTGFLHGILGQLQTQRSNSFTPTGVGNLSSNSVLF